MQPPAMPSPVPSALNRGAEGRLIDNIVHFARTLRAAGLPIGPGQVIDAVTAVETAGVRRRDDFYWTLHAVFVKRRDQRHIFDQAFHVFWRNPRLLEKMLSLLLPTVGVEGEPERKLELNRRLAEALGAGDQGEGRKESEEPPELEFDATLTFSDRELLQKKDFEEMSGEEVAAAIKAVARLRLPVPDLPTRRHAADPGGRRIDMRRTLRRSLRTPGVIGLSRTAPRRRPPALVILCDISGSMSRYTRLFLHFMHAVTNDRDRVHCFLFGTRLTNVSRHLRNRDVDLALAKAADSVADWAGGTRIGHCLHEFNRKWSRRVLGQGAVVLLITDGLDREGAAGLDGEMERLHKSCRRLIWLNPLLRYDAFEPRSQGNRAMLPHVDDFRPVHNLESLAGLADALSAPARAAPAMAGWHAKLAAIAAKERDHAELR